MVKVLSRALVLAVACLIAVSALAAEPEKKGKRERQTPEQAFKAFGSEDGKTLTKDQFVAAAKKRATDQRPYNEERTLGFWKRLAGEKDSITFEEFQKGWEKMREGFGKRGGKKRGE